MSDQDFFFDEEDGAKPEKKTSTPAKSPSANRPAAKRPAAPASASFFEQSVSMSIAALMAVIALLVGVIVGFVIPTGTATPSVTAATSAGETTQAAPQLTEEQLNSPTLPAGHPDLSGMSGGATATPSATSTGK